MVNIFCSVVLMYCWLASAALAQQLNLYTEHFPPYSYVQTIPLPALILSWCG